MAEKSGKSISAEVTYTPANLGVSVDYVVDLVIVHLLGATGDLRPVVGRAKRGRQVFVAEKSGKSISAKVPIKSSS